MDKRFKITIEDRKVGKNNFNGSFETDEFLCFYKKKEDEKKAYFNDVYKCDGLALTLFIKRAASIILCRATEDEEEANNGTQE
jgi:hypothetical protein